MNRLVDIAAMLVVVTGIMVFVRPNSQGPALVEAVGRNFQGALAVSSGQTLPGYGSATGFN